MKTSNLWKHEIGAGFEKWVGGGHEVVLVKLSERHNGTWRATCDGKAISDMPFPNKGSAVTGIRRVLLRLEREMALKQVA